MAVSYKLGRTENLHGSRNFIMMFLFSKVEKEEIIQFEQKKIKKERNGRDVAYYVNIFKYLQNDYMERKELFFWVAAEGKVDDLIKIRHSWREERVKH